MDFTFLLVMSAVTYGAWKCGFRVAALAIGAASACALMPGLPHAASKTLASTARIGAVGDALSAGLTLLIPIVGLMMLFGWRPKGR
jgi:hypothetical protein